MRVYFWNAAVAGFVTVIMVGLLVEFSHRSTTFSTGEVLIFFLLASLGTAILFRLGPPKEEE